MRHIHTRAIGLGLSIAAAFLIVSVLTHAPDAPSPEKRGRVITSSKKAQEGPQQAFHSCSICAANPNAHQTRESITLEEPLRPWLHALETGARQNQNRFSLTLPDGTFVSGKLRPFDPLRPTVVEGTLAEPSAGVIYFESKNGEVSLGSLFTRDGRLAWQIQPAGTDGSTTLAQTTIDQILCHNGVSAGFPAPPSDLILEEEQILLPEDYPPTSNNPDYQPTVPALESKPGTLGVLFLDFDGGFNDDSAWGEINVQHSGKSVADIIEIWQIVAEDFIPFNLNVTTDQAVYDAAPSGSRQRCYISTSKEATGNAGGVARRNSYQFVTDVACWVRPFSNHVTGLIVSHELGHTLGLSHDGNATRAYDAGYGSGEESWGSIMGSPFNKTIIIWSNGDYDGANNTEDDTAIIAANPGVGFATDEIGDSIGDAEVLRVFSSGEVDERSIISTREDLDVFTFRTTGGDIALEVEGAAVGQNTNFAATLFDSAGNIIVSAVDPEVKNVSLATSLTAGDYFLEIDCVGRTGTEPFSDYAILGGYKITGNIDGVTSPQRIFVEENTAISTVIGTVTPWETHTSATTFTLTEGDDDNLFTLNPTNGEISVSNTIDYEGLYTDYTMPPIYYFQVLIASLGVTETRTVFVEVVNVNDPPSVISTINETVLINTTSGVELGQVVAKDTEPLSPVVYSITDGDPGGADPYFAIDPNSGIVSTLREIDLPPSTVNLTVLISDTEDPPLTDTTTVTLSVIDIPAGYVPGSISQVTYNNVIGTSVSTLENSQFYPHCPDTADFLPKASFIGSESNLGVVIKGVFIAPVSGPYQFWVAGDNRADLYLSTDENPENLPDSPNATVTSKTAIETYDESEQASLPQALIAGRAYYFEARVKQGDDSASNLSVAWQRPAGVQEVIPGRFLSPLFENYPPSARTRTFIARSNALPKYPIGNVDAVDPNAGDAVTGISIVAGDPTGAFAIDALGELSIADPGSLPADGSDVTLTIETTDEHGASCSVDVSVAVTGADTILVPGLDREIFYEISGLRVSQLVASSKFPLHPDESQYLTQIDTPQRIGEQYGSRVRALLTPTVSGGYRFYISADHDADMFLSTDETPQNSTEICSVFGISGYQNWDDEARQESAVIYLTAGKTYYLEILQKEGGGNDYFAGGWLVPGDSEVTLIPAEVLAPYNINIPPEVPLPGNTVFEDTIPISANVVSLLGSDPEGEALRYAISSGNEEGYFNIDLATGAITAATELQPGRYPLEVTVQDSGRGGLYPLGEASASFEIVIGSSDYATFATKHWGENYSTLLLTGPNDDFDFDGLINAMEFAINGQDPTVYNSVQNMLIPINVEGTEYLQLNLSLNNNSSGQIAVQFSSTLAENSWTTVPLTIPSPSVITGQDVHHLHVRFRVSDFDELFTRISLTSE